jgi:uncharacterized protein
MGPVGRGGRRGIAGRTGNPEGGEMAAERASVIEELAERLRPIFQKHGVLRAVVFGSAARGEMSRRSDFDILVVQRTDKRFLDRYDPLLREVVAAVPERGVDLLIYTPEELQHLSDRPFVGRILREGKTLYERSEEPLPG